MDIGENLGQGFGNLIRGPHEQRKMQQENELFKKEYGVDLAGFTNPKERESAKQSIIKEFAKYGAKEQLLKKVMGKQLRGESEEEIPTENDISVQKPSPLRERSQEQKDAEALLFPELSRAHTEQEKLNYKKKADERKFQAEAGKDIKKKISGMRESLPRRKSALRLAKDAIESKEIGAFSLNNLSERLNIPEFRTAKGAQLVTASKEFLLGNMSRASARAQNLWFEQRLNSMFPQIGVSEEANETTAAMLDGELKMEEAYLQKYNEISKQDKEALGYVKFEDLEDRVYEQLAPLEDQILKETSFKTREIYEKEKGIYYLKEHAGEKVPQGTMLTPTMANLLKDKIFGPPSVRGKLTPEQNEQVRQAAKALGYEIPTKDEVMAWKR
jgi:hypothetical protein